MRNKILITIGVFFSVLIVLIVAAFFFTQTEYFRSLVRRTAESIVSSSTGQQFSIGRIEGNFFYNIKLEDVSFTVEDEKFVSIEEISLNYSIPHMLDGTMLFSKVVPVDKIYIKGVNANLIKYEDGTWNFSKIGSGEDKEKDEEKKAPPVWNIIIRDALLKNAEITLDDRENDKVTRYEIHETGLSATLTHITEKIEVDLKNADLDAPSQDLSVRGLSAKAVYSEEKAEIDNLQVLLNGAEIKIDAKADNLKDNPEFSFNLSAHNYKLEDVGTFNLETKGEGKFVSPKDIRANATIKIPESEAYGKKLTGSLEKITMSGTTIEIGEGNIKTELGELSIGGNADLSRIIAGEGANNFNINLALKDVKTTEVFSLLEEKSGTTTEAINTELGAVLNTQIRAEGSWVEFGDLTADAKIESLEIKGKEAGDLKLSGTAGYSSSGLSLDINSSLKQVDLGIILSKENLESNITSELDIKGTIPLEGDIMEQSSLSVKGEISPSKIYKIDIKKGEVDLSYENELLDIKALSIVGDSFNLKVEDGSAGTRGLDFSYDLEVEDLSFISAIVSGTEFAGSLKARGDVTGDISSPKVTIDAEAKGFEVNEDFAAESVKINGEGLINLDNPELKAEIKAEDVKVKEREIESIEVDAESEGEGVNLNAKIVENDQLNYEINTTLKNLGGREKNIEISRIKLDLEDTELKNKDTIFITVAPEKLIIDSFNLYYGDSSALADARIFYDGSLDADLKLNNLNLDDITKPFQVKTSVEGNISATVNLKGTMEAPQLNANITTRDLVYGGFDNDTVTFDLTYLNQNLNFKLLITDDTATVMQATGNSNIDLNFKKLNENIDKASISLTVNSAGVDLSPLASISEEIEKSEGTLLVDVKVTGSIKNPAATGQISLKDAVFKIQSLGNQFKVADALVELQGQKGILRQLEIQSGKGKGTFEGQIDVSDMSYNLTGNMENFLIKPERISANLDGDINVEGEGSKIKASGKITVAKSRITIPDQEEKQLEEIKFADEREEEFVVKSGNDTDFFQENFALDLQVKMTRNNWVRGRGANIELKGDLDVGKEFGRPVRISGIISTVRGTYETLGKLFRIERGRVSFSGSENINPNLDIRAVYRVSNVQIYVNISGTADSPQIKLTSNPPMTQTDIVSYVVFGAPSDQIGSGDRASIQGVATGLAGGIAAAQLEKVFGDKLALDVVSIGGGTNGPQIEVGKYLTEDLYIAYERGTSDSILDSTTITTNKVLVEYNIFNNVTLDADVGGENPGVDIFYNFNYK
ncbi:MAG: translocation/assembly module TamB domain-containing protein [Deltaproteobacteria bacterium]